MIIFDDRGVYCNVCGYFVNNSRSCDYCDKERVKKEMEDFAKSQGLSVTIEAL